MHRKPSNVVYWTGAVTIALVAVVIWGPWTLNKVLWHIIYQSQNEVQDRIEVESPDHRYVATGYHVLGGATVANMTIVVIRPKGITTSHDSDDSVLIADNIAPFQISWTSPRLITVKCSSDRVYSKMTSWHDVKVQFVDE